MDEWPKNVLLVTLMSLDAHEVCGAFKMADIGRLQRRDSADLIAVGAECNCCAASPSIGHPTRNSPANPIVERK